MTKITVILALILPASAMAQQWEYIAPMSQARANYGFCTLGNGKILVAGGGSGLGGPALRSTEIYDELTNTWTKAGDLNTGKFGAPIAKLLDGRLYFPSGSTGNNTSTVTSEIFDTSTRSWKLTVNAISPRYAESALTLPNGKVLLAAGFDAAQNRYLSSCELFDPTLLTDTLTDSVSVQQSYTRLFLDSACNKVTFISDHFVGKDTSIWFNETEEYNIASGVWTVVAHSQVPHGTWPQQSIQLPNGDILAPSGGTSNGLASTLIEVYTPSTHTWRTLGTLPHPRYDAATVYIGHDSVLVSGGYDPATRKALNDCEIINLRTGAVTPGPPLIEARYFHRLDVRTFQDPNDPCVEVTDVYIFGGQDETGIAKATCEKLEFRSQNPTLAGLPSSISLSGSVCNGIDTSISYTAVTCNTIRVDSVVLQGVPSSGTNLTDFPEILNNGDSRVVRLLFDTKTSGIFQGSVNIYYTTGSDKQLTSIPITVSVQNSSLGTFRAVIHDNDDAGDTVRVPVYLASNAGDHVYGFQLSGHYDNGEMLTPIDPEFDGTLVQNPILWDQNLSPSTFQVYVLAPFPINASKPLVNLTFLTHRTANECTTVTIDNIEFINDSTGQLSTPCEYAVVGDTAQICLAGASVQVLPPTEPIMFSVRYSPSSDRIHCSDNIPYERTFSLVDALGRSFFQRTLNPAEHEWEIDPSVMPSGLLFGCETFNGKQIFAKISIVR